MAQDLEPESITVSPDSKTAWVTLERNNAFAVVDLVAERVIDILPLGFKNNALPGKGLDASDLDGRIRIKTWHLRSWYEPDYLAAFTTIAGTFLVTANEGDPRDFSGYTEVARVADLPLDPAAFPNWATLQLPQNLGRLQVSRLDGMNASGQFTRLYAFGGRSLAVWTTRGELLADTGDAFERLMAAAVPSFFNVADDNNTFDGTSQGRGPEPEPLAVGTIGGRNYVFVGFERIGGIMVYDITDPGNPHFEQYINNRNFAVDPATVCIKDKPKSPDCAAAGDLSVEGVLFIPPDSSPNRCAVADRLSRDQRQRHGVQDRSRSLACQYSAMNVQHRDGIFPCERYSTRFCLDAAATRAIGCIDPLKSVAEPNYTCPLELLRPYRQPIPIRRLQAISSDLTLRFAGNPVTVFVQPRHPALVQVELGLFARSHLLAVALGAAAELARRYTHRARVRRRRLLQHVHQLLGVTVVPGRNGAGL